MVGLGFLFLTNGAKAEAFEQEVMQAIQRASASARLTHMKFSGTGAKLTLAAGYENGVTVTAVACPGDLAQRSAEFFRGMTASGGMEEGSVLENSKSTCYRVDPVLSDGALQQLNSMKRLRQEYPEILKDWTNMNGFILFFARSGIYPFDGDKTGVRTEALQYVQASYSSNTGNLFVTTAEFSFKF